MQFTDGTSMMPARMSCGAPPSAPNVEVQAESPSLSALP